MLAVIGPSPRSSDYEETRAKKRIERLKALHEETQKDLTTYAWVDKNKGVARIPIDRAMTYERSDWGNNANPVTAEQISALRKELASHPESFVEHDILAALDEDLPGGAPAGGAAPKPGEAAKPAAPPKP